MMQSVIHAALLFAAGIGSLAARSSAPADPFLSHLIGSWTLTGEIGGKETTHDVSFSWALGHEYVAMHEVSREKAADGSAAYEAIVYLSRDPRTSEYVVLWLDNTAASNFEPHGVGPTSIVGDSLPFAFHISPTDEFHTTFLYDRSADTWQWHMDDVQSGVAKPYARVMLRRAGTLTTPGPSFGTYPAGRPYTGAKTPLRLDRGTEAWTYRTMLREGYAATRINFAGHYVVTSWGCGTECRMFGIVDAKTGRAAILPGAVMSGAEYEIGSLLFVFEPPDSALQFFRRAEPYDTGLYASAYSFYYRWTGRALELIDSIKVDTTQIVRP